MLLIMFAVFYFMLIRPQQKKQREHQEMLRNLKKGDEVVTTGGLVGRISGLTTASPRSSPGKGAHQGGALAHHGKVGARPPTVRQ